MVLMHHFAALGKIQKMEMLLLSMNNMSAWDFLEVERTHTGKAGNFQFYLSSWEYTSFSENVLAPWCRLKIKVKEDK